jgi:hypothetical protein
VSIPRHAMDREPQLKPSGAHSARHCGAPPLLLSNSSRFLSKFFAEPTDWTAKINASATSASAIRQPLMRPVLLLVPEGSPPVKGDAAFDRRSVRGLLFPVSHCRAAATRRGQI